MGLMPRGDAERIEALLRAFGLPARPGLRAGPEALLALMAADKKARDGGIVMVLPTGIGSVVVRDKIDRALLIATLEAMA
jgi:3-dehydroquinate synthase